MWLTLEVTEYKCPVCDTQIDKQIEFEEYDSESIDDSSSKITCACGCVFKLQAEVEVMYHVVSKPKAPLNVPIEPVSEIPDVVAENQLPLLNQ